MLSLLPHRKDWLYLSYEDLISDTEASVEYLSKNLGLDDRRAMIERVAKPSRSCKRESTPERKQWIRARNREKLIDSWRSKIDLEQQRTCFRVLDRFEIDLYQCDSSMPDHRRLGRPGIRTRA